MALIYNKSYDTIKIKYKNNRKRFNPIVCIFGVLVNDEGLEIENSMLEWLLPEYDVYSVYQKYPGNLYEYPALRFAQWFSLFYNQSIILYVHTKGAFNNGKHQKEIRLLWKHEFTYPRNKLYINILKSNFSDISLPFRNGTCTWFNGMFISKRAFNKINKINYDEKRYYYECLFMSNSKEKNVRFQGILNDSISPYKVLPQVTKFLKYFKVIKNEKNNNFAELFFIYEKYFHTKKSFK